MIILDLIQNIALLVALAAIYQILGYRIKPHNLSFQILSGLLFGGVGIIGMLTPLHLLPGIIFDGRSVILSVAGLFGGPVVALVAALICAAYRLSLGGAGAWVGVAVTAESAAFGVLFYYLRRRSSGQLGALGLWGFGLLVHLVMLALMLALPGGAGRVVLAQVGLPILLIYPIATMLVCLLFQDYETRLADQLALRQSEEKYRLLAEYATDVIWVLDLQTNRFRYISPSVEHLRGYTAEEILAQDMTAALTPASFQYLQAIIPERLQKFEQGRTEFYTDEIEQPRKDGSTVWTEVTTRYLRNPLTGRIEAIGVSRDISERKQAQETLRRQNEYLLALQATTLDLLSQLDLDTLLENIVKRAGQLLNTSSGYLDLVEPETGQLVPRVGLGKLAESLQHQVQPGEGIAGIVWQTHQPLVVNDYDKWPGRIGNYTFGLIYSIIGVPLLSGDQILGVLGLGYEYSTRQSFGPEAIEILNQFGHLAALAIENARLFSAAQQELAERKRAEQKIATALQEKEILLRELYHRTKNNMQVILAMLSLEAARSQNEEIKTSYKEIANRIQAMALVHQKLYQSQNLTRINLQEYLQELAELLLHSFRYASEKISLRCAIEPVEVLIDTAMPCGLVVTELISNSLKYAFPGESSGEISLQLTRQGQEIELCCSDNGVGVPPDFDFQNLKSYGLRSVLALVEHQLQGQVSFTSDNGLACHIRFSDTLYSSRVDS